MNTVLLDGIAAEEFSCLLPFFKATFLYLVLHSCFTQYGCSTELNVITNTENLSANYGVTVTSENAP